MGGTGNEYRLLAPLIPALLVVPILAIAGVESVDAAFLIVLAPFVAFPIILVSGQLYNGNSTWKQNLKEGGVIGLSALLVSLTTSLWVLVDYLRGARDITKEPAGNVAASWGDWISFDVLLSDYSMSSGRVIGVGVWVDSITLMLLFVATFLCFLFLSLCLFLRGLLLGSLPCSHRFKQVTKDPLGRVDLPGFLDPDVGEAHIAYRHVRGEVL